MKKIYLPILLLTLAVSSCDTFDKVPSSEWPSEGAIKTLEDLQFAVNGVYESQTSSIDAGTNPRGSYAGDFFLYADQRGSDFKAIGSNKQTVDVYAYQATKNSSDSYYFYKRFYLSLARINKVLEGVKKSGLEGAEVDVQVGELYAWPACSLNFLAMHRPAIRASYCLQKFSNPDIQQKELLLRKLTKPSWMT